MRWEMILQEFDYSMKYHEGKLNKGADALSRMLKITKVPDTFYSHKNIALKLTKKGTKNNESKFVFSQNNESKILKKFHETLGHPGISTLYNTLKKIIKVNKLKKKISLIIQECHKSQTCKHFNK
ncbi:hypothetical protein DMUE_4153 [Dictyocoela muelleri]|nr:hypothetical protein DMUE_4153 [Dictyocoela muelleri]